MGVTLSEEQLTVARRRAHESGISHTDFRLQDYRAITEELVLATFELWQVRESDKWTKSGLKGVGF